MGRYRQPVVLVALVMGLAGCSSSSGSDTTSSTTTTTLAITSTSPPSTTTSMPATTSTTLTDFPNADVMELFAGAVVRLRDYGPLSIGATEDELRSRYGIILTEGECPPTFNLANGPSNVTVDLDQGRITRVTIHEPTANLTDPINANPILGVETLSGVGFGATEQEVLATYGDRVIPETIPAEFPFEGEQRLTFVPRDAEDAYLRLIFHLDSGRVTSMRFGETEAVDMEERCV